MKIGIFGATGSYDFGDYAMMVHNIQELYAINKEHTFIIFTLSEKITYDNIKQNIKDERLLKRIEVVDDNFINENNISYDFFSLVYRKMYRILKKRDVREKFYENLYKNTCKNCYENYGEKFINSLKKVDLCLFNGGGYLQNSWQYHNIRFMAEVQLAKKLNKPVVFMSNSVGPMARYDRYTRETLPLVDYIMIRDGKNFSWTLLENYGVQKKMNGPDDLFDACDKYCDNKRDEEEYVIIEIMAWIARAPKGVDFVVKVLAQFINYLIEEENKKIRLINFDKEDVIAKKAISSLFSMVKQPDKMAAMYEISNMYEVFEWYKGCSYSLSFKYHPVILALGAGKPCSAVITDDDGYYKSKLEGAFINCDMDEKIHVIHINDMNFEKLKQLYIDTKEQACDEKVKKTLYCIRKKYVEAISNKELYK